MAFVEVRRILKLRLLAQRFAKDDILFEQKYDQLLSFEIEKGSPFCADQGPVQ